MFAETKPGRNFIVSSVASSSNFKSWRCFEGSVENTLTSVRTSFFTDISVVRSETFLSFSSLIRFHLLPFVPFSISSYDRAQIREKSSVPRTDRTEELAFDVLDDCKRCLQFLGTLRRCD